MDLEEYFEKTEGLGILATADSRGNVDLAIYSRPHVIDEQTVAWIMSDRLSHANLQSNPSAAYMFIESNEGYQGKRLYLTKLREEADPERITQIRRRRRQGHTFDAGSKYLVYFKVGKVRPLVGD